MKKFVLIIIFLLVLSYAISLDSLLQKVSNSPEIVYDKLLALKPIDKNFSIDLSQKGTSIDMDINYPLSNSLSLSAYASYNGDLIFGAGANFVFGEKPAVSNSSFWQKIVLLKMKVIDLYFDTFINPKNKDYDLDLLKYLCSFPLNSNLLLDTPNILVLKKDQNTLFKKFYNSISYNSYSSSFEGYNLNFKVLFSNPLSYSVSLNMPFHFDYDNAINSQYSKILLDKMTISFREYYREYYLTLEKLLEEKSLIDSLNKKYIETYNQNIKGKIDYSEVLKVKEEIKNENNKINNLSLLLTKYAYKILVLAGEK